MYHAITREPYYEIRRRYYAIGSDINNSATIGIDVVLIKLRLDASASVKSEVEREKRIYFENHIEF